MMLFSLSLRSVVPCLSVTFLCLALLLAAPDARAGSYSGPVYSGGELDSTTTSGVMFGPPQKYSGSP